MIRLFKKNETDFDHNEHILQPTKCEVSEDENGIFELDYESLLNKEIEVGSIIKAPTPRGEQLFRIYKPTHTLRKTTAKARHIFYDLLSNFLEDSRPTQTTGSGALASILGGTLYPHRFEGISNIANTSTAYYVRKNPVQAILGLDNCLVKNWGGYIKRDNFTIRHIENGRDNGYEIRYGKNLQGIREEIDDSKVVTKIMPTWVVENVVHMLPEKYVDSPLIANYPHPKVAEIRINVPESVSNKVDYVRTEAAKYFSEHDIDKPIINYKVDFISLRKISEYKDFVWLEELDLYDVVNVIVPKMDLQLKSNVISYKYDCIKERFNQIEIGNFTNSLAKNTSSLIKEIDNKIDVKASELEAKQQEATDKLAGVNGGNIVIRRTADGKPYEILVMDTADMATAREVVRINKNGIGFSHNGIIGPYSVAITIDGHIVADFMDTGTMTANIVKAGVLSNTNGRISINMETGAINFDSDLTYNPTTRVLKIGGTAVIDAVTIKEGTLDSARIGDLSANKIKGGAIDANSYAINGVDIRNMNANNMTSGTVGRPYDYGDLNNTSTRTQINGSNVSFTSNSSYISIRDTGGRGEVTVNGTIGATGSGYYYEMNSGGYYGGTSKNSARAMMQTNGTSTYLHDGGGTNVLQLRYGDLYYKGKKIVLNTDNNGIHYE